MGKKFGVFLFSIVVFLFAFMINDVDAVQCYTFNTETTCAANNDCQWFSDEWGGWCEQKGCWLQYTQNSCINSNNATHSSFINFTCTWSSGSNGWCENTNCWTYDETNESACESNSDNLKCTWYEECEGPWEFQCWQYETQSECAAQGSCEWGRCDQEGCWDYTDRETCVANTGETGAACGWNIEYSYCYETSCGDYTNMTGCQSNACIWDGGYCTRASCSDFSFVKASTCVNNTANLSCSWDGVSYCSEAGCWQNNDQTACGKANGCTWETDSGGWCEEGGCWDFSNDTYGLNGNATEAKCVNNTVGLTCVWDSAGWCYENVSSKSCTDFLSLRECADSFYCLWNATSETCSDPAAEDQDFNFWNPGCYIFDSNLTDCANAVGCFWNTSVAACKSNASMMQANQLNCTMFGDSSLCNNIPVLDTCCSWQAGSCSQDRFTDGCYNDLNAPPDGASYCEDYESYTDKTLCEQIAASPWYMPCIWSNATERCTVDHDDVFGTGEKNLMLINNKQSCEYAGGDWVTESYCDANNQAISTGRCEQKFGEERNCDKACFACDLQSDGTNWSSLTDAKNACVSSAMGICEFTTDSTAANSFGACTVKDEFRLGLASKDCDTDCNSCTHMGDPTSSDSSYRPSTYCKNSKANCKWVPDLIDPTDETEGRCTGLSEKTCESRCDKCAEESLCTTYGAKNGDTTLAKQCNWDDNLKICKPKTGAEEYEICWNGVDDNQDNKIDCADSMCFSDPFCGGDYISNNANCFGYTTEGDCNGEGCAWINENWGSWCDIPGSNCWSFDGTNQTYCEAQGCEWHSGFGGMCEEDWDDAGFSNCFAASNVTSCSGIANCTWVEDNFCGDVGGWCETAPGYQGEWVDCWELYSQPGLEDEAGCNASVACSWHQDDWCQDQGDSAGWCDHLKFSCWQQANQTTCQNATFSPFCNWVDDEWGSWCEEKTDGAGSCWNQNDQSSCTGAGCDWISGLCDPPGFGGDNFGGFGDDFGGSGMSCFKFDGDQTGCEAKAGCGWFPESSGACQVNMSSDCGQYTYNQTVCGQQPQCYWDTQGSFCDFIAFECFTNQTLQYNQGACNNVTHCAWNSYFGACEPGCFESGLTEAQCGQVNISNNATNKACLFSSGWCEPVMGSQFFKEMQNGAPVDLGTDATGDASPPEIDITNFGMKDMGQAFGFGTTVDNLTNAALCNDIRVGNSTGLTGVGKNATKFYWFLDTDGNSTNNCNASDSAASKGWEFYIKYDVSYSNDTKDVSESYGAFKCSSGAFVASEIKVSTIRREQCQEIGGGMVAIDKNDLERYPDLYTSGQDIRVRVTTANVTGNITNPSDVASVGYMTPGAIDFDMDDFDFFKYNQNSTDNKGIDVANAGFVKYSVDCFTEAGCDDYACANHPYCVDNGYGVEATGFTDTRIPKINGVSKEVYTDSALINYLTDKPSNGTVLFYHNDSTCKTLNDTIYDIGVQTTDDTKDDYKMWHEADIYDDAGNNSLDYNLTAGETYYYKVEICDDVGKCGTSKCSSFVTAASAGDCGFCNFVTKLDVPTGWSVHYDTDEDNTFDHEQGAVCGTTSGLKVNYSTGRSVTVRLNDSSNNTYIEFVGAKLTKTGVRSDVRDVDESDDILGGSVDATGGGTTGRTGMDRDTRDKIINNLNPDKCLVKFPTNGTCSELWHCNDNLTTCVERSGNATLNETGTDYCVWEIPGCQFSQWAGAQPDVSVSSSSSPDSGSSGGSGGGSGPLGQSSDDDDDDEGSGKDTDSRDDDDASDADTPVGKVVEDLREAASDLTWAWILLGVVGIVVLVEVAIHFRNKRR
tara:strand:+ start:1829 stop:7249 length:5421 start_codon:yes stop_codon:yes gene_type:complete